ncbi:MAG: sugar ABC transporter permease [Proteobacteria bacterium]|nr:sugar ABC transporter permease [Pseudomonadota bacterium]
MHQLLKRHPVFIGSLFLPSITLIGVLLSYPLINGIRLSFTDAGPLNPVERWIGADNYLHLIQDLVFWEVITNSAVMIVSSVACALVFGLAIALLLDAEIVGRRWFRAAVFQVWVIPWITVAVLWGWLFSHEFGIVNQFLLAIGVIDEPLNWLVRPNLSRFAVISGWVWRITPFMMVMALAALQGVSKEVLEAATVDGATFWQRFRFVVLPLIGAVLVVSALLQTVRLMQELTLPWVLTKGGPGNATTTLSLYLYKTAFQQWEFGLASAIGVMWTIALITFAIAYLRLLKPRQ